MKVAAIAGWWRMFGESRKRKRRAKSGARASWRELHLSSRATKKFQNFVPVLPGEQWPSAIGFVDGDVGGCDSSLAVADITDGTRGRIRPPLLKNVSRLSAPHGKDTPTTDCRCRRSITEIRSRAQNPLQPVPVSNPRLLLYQTNPSEPPTPPALHPNQDRFRKFTPTYLFARF